MSELVSNSLFVSLIDDDDNSLGHCYFVLNVQPLLAKEGFPVLDFQALVVLGC